MYKTVGIRALDVKHIDNIVDIWFKQFTKFCSKSAIYPHIGSCLKDRENYILNKVKGGQAYGAFIADALTGFITCDIFNFHGADSAMCHFCGNAADLYDRASIYTAMYREASKLWVEKGVLSHYVVIATNDTEVKDALFELGFGAYSPYGYACFNKPLPYKSDYEISVACETDAGDMQEIVLESVDYLASSPLYLKDPFSMDEVANAINEKHILLAKDKGRIVGFMTTSIADKDDIYQMYTKGCLLMGAPGTFIKEQYRNKGIGSHFLSETSLFCIQKNIPYAQVSWESANLYGNRFWPKYFRHTLLGMKRVLPPDVR